MRLALCLALATCLPSAARDDTAVTTADRPASIIVNIAPEQKGALVGPLYLEFDLVGFRPPQKGAVEVIVRVLSDEGEGKEIGRFTPFPAEAFGPQDPSAAQHYGFRVPDEIAKAAGTKIRLSVELAPLRGDIKDARAELANARIRGP